MMFLALKRTSGDHSLVHASIFITIGYFTFYTLTPFIELISRSLSLSFTYSLSQEVSVFKVLKVLSLSLPALLTLIDAIDTTSASTSLS